ncbi:hypothetical protein ABN028_08035 [Actinopolymorpha sp. B17G11]|uniref:hypothetical protein n=1 Tax=unclassified Actinopolymorpha TaxID=2627063 RepID=UPI0032D929AB
MPGNATSSSSHSAGTLSPLPPPIPKGGRGYLWAMILVGALLAVTLGAVGFDFFSVPGVDPVRAGSWYFMISLMIIFPAAVTVFVMSCGVVAIMRSCGARRWPGLLQALPAVVIIVGLLLLLVRWLFSGPDLG